MFLGTAISMWLCHYTYTTSSKFGVIYHQQIVKLWQPSLPFPQWLITICNFCLSFASNWAFQTLWHFAVIPTIPATHLTIPTISCHSSHIHWLNTSIHIWSKKQINCFWNTNAQHNFNDRSTHLHNLKYAIIKQMYMDSFSCIMCNLRSKLQKENIHDLTAYFHRMMMKEQIK